MNRPHERRVALVACLLLGVAACGEPSTNTPADAGAPIRPAGSKVLTRVGPGTIDAHPGDKLTLSALLSASEIGPIADGQVTWRIVEDPGGTTLSDDKSATDGTGVAKTDLTLGDTGTVTIKADSSGATSKAIWKIDVAPVIKHLRIVPGTGVNVTDGSAAHANVSAVANKQVNLRVKVTAEEGDGEVAVPSEPVTFAFATTIQGATFNSGTNGQLTTGGDGEASMSLTAGSTTGNYKVVAHASGMPDAEFNVTVTSGGAAGGGCTSSNQCSNGQVCVSGQCQALATGGSCGDNDRPCPVGYACDAASGSCKPAFGGSCDRCPDSNATDGLHCDNGQCVADNPECDPNTPCPTGFDCQSGVCVPGDGSIDVTGHWYTKHAFNIHDALPRWVQFTTTGLHAIDQALLGQLNLPSWVNSLLRAIVQQYIPDWVQKMVYILDNIGQIFSYLRAEGEMDLVPNGGPAVLSGEETWTSFVFYLLAQCGQNIGGSIYQPPQCARMDIYTNELPTSMSVEVKPFAARVGGANGTYTVFFDKREVKMKLGGLIKFVLDQMISLTTGYPSLEDKPCPGPNDPPAEGECGPGSGALSNLVDCVSINEWVEDQIGIDVTGLCKLGVSAAGKLIADQLKQIVVTNDVLNFNGQATARAGSTPTYAEQLGFEDTDHLDNNGHFTRNPQDGWWKGKFSVGVSVSDVPGGWYGSREPLPTP